MQWYMVYILTPPKPSRDKSPDCTTLLASTSKAVADEMGKGVWTIVITRFVVLVPLGSSDMAQ